MYNSPNSSREGRVLYIPMEMRLHCCVLLGSTFVIENAALCRIASFLFSRLKNHAQYSAVNALRLDVLIDALSIQKSEKDEV